MSATDELTLRAALRARRPDPDAFRAGVLRKIAERAAHAEQPRRAAAAFLPLQLTQSKTGAALTLPVVSLAVLALTFIGALRAILGLRGRVRAERAMTDAQADDALALWWRQHAVHAGISLVALGLLARYQPAQALIAVLVVSMLAVTHACGRLVESGAASRATVGKLTSGFLAALLVAMLLFRDFASGHRTFTIADQWIPFVLLIGLLACDALQRWSASWSLVRKAATVIGPTVLALGGGVWIHAELRPVPMSRAIAWASSFERPVDDVVNWTRLGAIGESAARGGGPSSTAAIDWTAPRRVLAEAWRQRGRTLIDEPLFVTALDGAARLDLMPDELWQALRADPETQRLLTSDTALRFPSVSGIRLRALVRGGLTDAQRDHLASALERGWPAVEEPDALQRMALLTELADCLGRPLPNEPLRASVARALEAHWMPLDGRGDGLAAFARTAAEALLRQGSADTPALLLLPPTRMAATLIARFGTPASIDLKRVAAFLRRTATPTLVEALAPRWWPMVTTQPYRYEASAGLHAMRAITAPRAGSWLRESTLLGTLLLVGLCVVATLRMRPGGVQP